MTRTSGRIDWYGRSREWKDEFGFRAKDEVEKPVDQWNRYEVIAAGDRMVNLLNAKLVSGAFRPIAHPGQNSGAKRTGRDLCPPHRTPAA